MNARPRRAPSLTARTTLSFALIACVVIGALGAYFYQSVKTSMEARADLQLIGRVTHFRRLASNVYTVSELKDRPLLFETMLGAERDVLIFRKPGEPPFIHVNPDGLEVPAELGPLMPGDGVGLTPDSILRTRLANGVPIHWAAARARSNEDGSVVEVIAAHPLGNEVQMLAAYRDRVLLGTLVGMLAATALAVVAIRRGLRPVGSIAARAAEIGPASFTVRLDEHGAPAELHGLVRAFNAMLDRLGEGYERLSQFSADLAHEIRTPVGALIGQTQVTLSKARRPEEYQELLESNLEELSRLGNIAENILFLAQADHARLTIEHAAVPLQAELNKIAEYFEGPADEKGMRFEIAAEGTLWANPLLCRRAINNLVVNAVRYGTPGTVIRLSGVHQAGGTVVAVENQGDDIPQEQLHRLFDRFYRGDVARSQVAESNGLGLAIVKAIMTLHGGQAEATCPAPGRLRFALHFPPASPTA
ncbi:heavy metal sensor histidine kinase [Cupriavidus sp. 2TAF22]|uniref:heavy metal sensor histidine kinase n=1 Tax=unclassified Cupriavidus TaxID=2640874 RepID=UPI003F91B298